jgi:hypothetical protein
MKEKRDRVLDEGRGKNKSLWIVAAVVIVAGIAYMFASGMLGQSGLLAGVSAHEIEPMDYADLRVDKQVVTPVESGDMVGVKLSDLEKYRMLYFKYNGKPVLIYADQYGNIVSSIAMCEPCKNDEEFFIQDNILVCGKCFTKWNLGSHYGVSGGCKDYPPEIIEYTVSDGNVFVKKSDIDNWRPRV